MNRPQLFLKGNSSTILTIMGSLGVISTTILAVKNTPKAIKLINDAKDNKKEELTIMETINVAWTAYIPSLISGIATIACIAGANCLNIKKQQSLISSYVLLDNAFKEYRKKITEKYGEEPDQIYHEITRKQIEQMNTIYDETLFFEINSMRFFEASMYNVLSAECKTLEQLEKYGNVTLNDFYSYIGLTSSPYGDVMGWSKFQMKTEQYVDKLEFFYTRSVMSNGIVCYNITTNIEPTMDYFCF